MRLLGSLKRALSASDLRRGPFDASSELYRREREQSKNHCKSANHLGKCWRRTRRMKSRVLVGFARMEATCRRRLTRDEVVSESYDSVPKSKQRSMSTVIVCCGSCSRGVAGTWGEKQDSTMQYSAGLVSAVCTLFTSGLSGDVMTAPATSCPSRSSLGLVLFEQKGMCSETSYFM